MGVLAQVLAVTSLNVKSLPRRMSSSLVAVVGFAGVVAVFVAVLSIAEGFDAVMAGAGSPDVALVLRAGSDTEMSSSLTLEQMRLVAQAEGVARGEDGEPLAAGELFVIVDVPKRSTGTDANVPLRGVSPASTAIRQDFEIVEGRLFAPGRNEVIVGRAAQGQFAGLDVGSRLHWGQSEWEVVGVFSASGAVYESEIWTDVKVLQPAYRRGSGFQTVFVRLESEEALTEFKDSLTSDPRLDVDVHGERAYYAEQSRVLRLMVEVLGNLIAALMAIGATFGALNTMYSSVAARRREVATLRALGFQAIPVMVSVMVESLILAFIGGALGGGLAYLAVDGFEAATMNWQTFSQVAFSLTVTPDLIQGGLAYALLMGLLGGLFPAIKAVRVPIAVALRRA